MGQGDIGEEMEGADVFDPADSADTTSGAELAGFTSRSAQVCIRRSLSDGPRNQQLAAHPMKLLFGRCEISDLFMPSLAARWSPPTSC